MDIEQILKKTAKKTGQQGDKIFALDIGTRTVVGIVGEREGDKYSVLDCVVVPHTRRAMVDGQVEDIKQVAKIVGQVKEQLEQRTGLTLTRACIAAAGRALKTLNVNKEFDVSDCEIITEEMVATMEMETISAAQSQLDEETKSEGTLFYCVGHNVVNYRLDDYKMIALAGHKGRKAEVDMVVAFLPGIVVEGLYSVMELNKLEVQSLTLEPIAAMNVIVPQELRLINIALVDIGAGTSDIAIAKDGSIVAYAMATVAGDEITEEIIRSYLVDFSEAEKMKYDSDSGDKITYKDIFGLSHTIDQGEFIERILPSMDNLAATVCDTILKINNTAPQAVFLVGGGSLIKGLTTLVADKLGMDESRVAVGGSDFLRGVKTGDFKMGAEFITPIGIGVTALEDRGYDFSVVTVNDRKVRVFDTKKLTVYQLLTLAGYKTSEFMGHSGQSLSFTLNGSRIFRKGTVMSPAEVTVNGKAAGLTTIVTQGDNVRIVPAKNGENAHTTVKDEIDLSKFPEGQVTFGGKKYKFGAEILVNGVKKSPDYEIQPLDDITTAGILTLGDLLSSIGIEYSDGFAINGELASQAEPLKDGDVITIKLIPSMAESIEERAKAAETEKAVSPVRVVEETAIHTAFIEDPMEDIEDVSYTVPEKEDNEPHSLAYYEAQGVDLRSLPVPKPPEPVLTEKDAVPQLTVILNEKPITLPPKTDGEPHTFIELMSYANIDTKNPMGSSVELTLNGREIGFGEELREGDRAIIRWRN
ncbi:MAG: pilus assembly protein PilM [Firmicutes bacterium]|nr:pilus assembly protein PilM [[Eubacterium] siraeum]MCM1487258.1 pilus assembly protein PilM [Bacillota bacterium]